MQQDRKQAHWKDPFDAWSKTLIAATQTAEASKSHFDGLARYSKDFYSSFLSSTAIFSGVEMARMPTRPLEESTKAYAKLFATNSELMRRGAFSSIRAITDIASDEAQKGMTAWWNTWLGGEGETIDAWAQRQARVTRAVVKDYPEAIEAVEKEYGFHFERGIHPLVAETDRFLLYRVTPTDKTVPVDEGAKPVIIIPPYVLGSNILSFLPGKGRSYAHAYANQGVPTYIRIMKNIWENEPVQLTTPEDDATDTKHFCEIVRAAHGRPVTLNGYCQGGYTALCNVLSGEFDELVDALITCVSPMDGTHSSGLSGFLSSLPDEFNDLAYGTKALPNGNRVADGHLMGWVYKLKSIEAENPISAYYRDLSMFRRSQGEIKISKSAAAINYWLANERSDLPIEITKMSFESYNSRISDDGTLPVTLFGKKLNLKRLQEKKIPWLICYGEKDDLVEKEAALAPTAHVDAELTEFPRGHVAIATSWSDPTSKCALHTVFDGYRGPVRYQLDLDAKGRAESAPSTKPTKKKTPAKKAAKKASK